MSQLALSFIAPSDAFDPSLPPDSRHEWLCSPAWGGRETEWQCWVCGEHATVCPFTGKWLFLRPQLAKPPRGPWHFDQVSHACEPMDWQ